MPRDWVRKAPRAGWSAWHGSTDAAGEVVRKDEEVRSQLEEVREPADWKSEEAEPAKPESRAEDLELPADWGEPAPAFGAPPWEWPGADTWFPEQRTEADLQDAFPPDLWFGEDGDGWYGDNFFNPALWGSYEDGPDGFIGRRHGQVPKRANLKEQFEKGDAKKVTTLMLRNVPNAYDRETLMEELASLGFEGSFDFLYLPIDTSTKNNVGYAFVNFCTEDACMRCMEKLRGYYFRGQPYNRRRAAIVSVAHLQGLEANLQHYSRTQVFNARLPCQRPWVAREAAEALVEHGCPWAPGGFAKLMEDAAARPGTQPDTQSLIHRRRARERWMFRSYGLAAYDMMPDGFFGPGDQAMYSNDAPRYHSPGQVLHDDGLPGDVSKEVGEQELTTAPSADKPSNPDQNRNAVSVLSRMLRGEAVDQQDLPEEDDMDDPGIDGLVPDMMPMLFDESWYRWSAFPYSYDYDAPAPYLTQETVQSGQPDGADSERTALVLTNVPRGFSARAIYDVLRRLRVYDSCRGLCFLEAGTGYGQRTSVLQFNSAEEAEVAKLALQEATWGGERKGEDAKIQVEDLLTHDSSQFSADGAYTESSWKEGPSPAQDFTEQWDAMPWFAPEQQDMCVPVSAEPAPKTTMEWLEPDIAQEEEDIAKLRFEEEPFALADNLAEMPHMNGSASSLDPVDDSSACPESVTRKDPFVGEEDLEKSWPKLPSKDWVDAEVCGMYPKGAWVRMTAPSTKTDFRSLLKKEHFTEPFLQESHVGMKIKVRVLEANVAKKQLYLSMLEPGQE
ncbi:ML3 [Symbiodinium pilosum]|uniref:ML3 protein n=1 Tax=Symbiodinium pilosum TaxID=2952 RepID=A0A812W2J2_SYMPI|nr:ML3 [Symbiodinium pilosum]